MTNQVATRCLPVPQDFQRSDRTPIRCELCLAEYCLILISRDMPMCRGRRGDRPSGVWRSRARPMPGGGADSQLLVACALVWAQDQPVPAVCSICPVQAWAKASAVQASRGRSQKPRQSRRKERQSPGKASSIDSEAPPGFEKLLKPQRTLVDVFHANRRIGQTFAVLQARAACASRKPAAVVKLVGVRKSRRSPSSSRRFPAGLRRTSTGCAARPIRAPSPVGQLSPKVAGIIFNEARLKVTVFVKT